MGAFVVVKTSALDSLYEGLPVLIVNDYSQVNKEFLEKNYKAMKKKHFCMQKLTADYWLAKIHAYKTM